MITEERLEKVEKELARAKRRSRVILLAAAMTVAAVFLLCAGDAVPKVVRAERFELVDTNGTVRAVLHMSQLAGGPELSLSGPSGSAHLRVFDSGPQLGLYDKNKTGRVALMVSDVGSELNLRDENGKLRNVLFVASSGPGLSLFDENGMGRVALGMAHDVPIVGVCDPSGKLIWHAP